MIVIMKKSPMIIKIFILSMIFLCLGALGWYQAVNESRKLNQLLRDRIKTYRVTAPPAPPAAPSALIELGHDLFFDKILSGNKNISCATCHNPRLGSADSSSLSIGQGGYGVGEDREIRRAQLTIRNAPALFNLGDPTLHFMFWDGRVHRDPETGALETPVEDLNGRDPYLRELATFLKTALEVQTLMPPADPAEMRGRRGENEIANALDRRTVWDLLLRRILDIPEYRMKFSKAYPDVIPEKFHYGHVARALAAFIGHEFVADQTPLDLFIAGDDDALSDKAKRGALLFFGEAKCASCHSGPHLSDFSFASKAVPQIGPGKLGNVWEEQTYIVRRWTVSTTDDFGRYNVTRELSDRWRFKTPALRNVALTGPWMHNGAFTHLDEVIEHMLNPAKSLKEYDGKNLKRPEFTRNLIANKKWDDERLETLDPRLRDIPPLSSRQKSELIEFLVHGLTDRRWEGRQADVPDRVPSGIDPKD